MRKLGLTLAAVVAFAQGAHAAPSEAGGKSDADEVAPFRRQVEDSGPHLLPALDSLPAS